MVINKDICHYDHSGNIATIVSVLAIITIIKGVHPHMTTHFKRTGLLLIGALLMALLMAAPVGAAAPCNEAATVGGGALGVSPGPVGPPNSLGWDVGSGQCNGSFSVVTESFPGGPIELGIRAEDRREGQVAPTGPNEYTVQLGYDDTVPAATNRAWWNFNISIAYDDAISTLDSLTLEIVTDAGTNLPASPSVDLLALRGAIDDRNNQPNSTAGFADLYQISQNPEFGWFTNASDTDANPTGAFNYDEEGAWRFILTATDGGSTASLTVCIHTPGAACLAEPYNLLKNPSFEIGDGTVATYWKVQPGGAGRACGYPVLAKHGECIMAFADKAIFRKLYQQVYPPTNDPMTYEVSVWINAHQMERKRAFFGVRVFYTDGTREDFGSVVWKGSYAFAYRSKTFVPSKEISRMYVGVLDYGGTSGAWNTDAWGLEIIGAP